MAKITKVQLNDTINVHRVRFNQLIDSIGDLDTLNAAIIASIDSDGLERTVINAINELNSRIPVDPFDSDEVLAMVDSDYVQLRQDYAYSSLTGTPNVLDSADVLSTFAADQTANQLTGTSPSIDIQANELYYHTTSGNTTYSFGNAPSSGTVESFILHVTAGGSHTLSWPASVEWPGGTAPPSPASGATNVYVFMTYDGGTTYYGFLPGEAVA